MQGWKQPEVAWPIFPACKGCSILSLARKKSVFQAARFCSCLFVKSGQRLESKIFNLMPFKGAKMLCDFFFPCKYCFMPEYSPSLSPVICHKIVILV